MRPGDESNGSEPSETHRDATPADQGDAGSRRRDTDDPERPPAGGAGHRNDTDSEDTGGWFVRPTRTSARQTEEQPAQQKPAEKKPAQKKPAEKKPAEQQAAEAGQPSGSEDAGDSKESQDANGRPQVSGSERLKLATERLRQTRERLRQARSAAVNAVAAGRAATGKTETGKTETGKTETGKADAGKTDTDKKEQAQADTSEPGTGVTGTKRPEPPPTAKPAPTERPRQARDGTARAAAKADSAVRRPARRPVEPEARTTPATERPEPAPPKAEPTEAGPTKTGPTKAESAKTESTKTESTKTAPPAPERQAPEPPKPVSGTPVSATPVSAEPKTADQQPETPRRPPTRLNDFFAAPRELPDRTADRTADTTADTAPDKTTDKSEQRRREPDGGGGSASRQSTSGRDDLWSPRRTGRPSQQRPSQRPSERRPPEPDSAGQSSVTPMSPRPRALDTPYPRPSLTRTTRIVRSARAAAPPAAPTTEPPTAEPPTEALQRQPEPPTEPLRTQEPPTEPIRSRAPAAAPPAPLPAAPPATAPATAPDTEPDTADIPASPEPPTEPLSVAAGKVASTVASKVATTVTLTGLATKEGVGRALAPLVEFRARRAERPPEVRQETRLHAVSWLGIALGGLIRTLPAVAVVFAAVFLLRGTGTPAADIWAYAGYAVGTVMLPGLLVHRALRRAETLAEDLALGAVTGLALELGAWAIYTSQGIQEWLWTWPLVIVAITIMVPPLHRRCWRLHRYPKRMPLLWGWAVAGVAVVALGFLTLTYLATVPLPPSTAEWYRDLLYHLAMAEEATRSVPLTDPEIAGQQLDYHWFSNAHMAAAHHITGVPLTTLMLRLWLPPIVVLSVVLIAVVGARMSGRPWVGPIAAVLLFVGGELDPWPWTLPIFGAVVPVSIWASPSQTYAWVFIVPAAFMIAQQLAPRPQPDEDGTTTADPVRRPGGWVMLVIFLVAVSGAKSTALPILLAGVLFALALRVLGPRKVPISQRITGRWLAVTCIVASVFYVGQKTLYGESAYGTVLIPGSIVWRSGGVASMVGQPEGFRPPGLVWGDSVAQTLLIVAVGLWALTNLLRYVGALGPFWRKGLALAPGQAVFTGALLAGAAAAFLLDHPGSSQIYFLRTAAPLGVIASAWGVAELLPARRTKPLVGAALVGIATAVGLLVWYGAKEWVDAPEPGPGGGVPRHEMVGAVIWPLVGAFSLVTVIVAGYFALGWLFPRIRRIGAALTVVCLLALCLPSLALDSLPALPTLVDRWPAAGSVYNERIAKGKPLDLPPDAVTTDEWRAGQWVDEHTDTDEVLATNAHCGFGRPDVKCDARNFIISAVTGRRVLVGGWGYTAKAIGDHGKDDKLYYLQPYPDKRKLDENDEVFLKPSAAAVNRLRDKYGVRWLVLDERGQTLPGDHKVRDYGPVAAVLERHAKLRFLSGTVRVYEIPAR